MKPKKIRAVFEGADEGVVFKITFEVGSSGTGGPIKDYVQQALLELRNMLDSGAVKLENADIKALETAVESGKWTNPPHRSFEVTTGEGFDLEDFIEKLGSALVRIQKI